MIREQALAATHEKRLPFFYFLPFAFLYLSIHMTLVFEGWHSNCSCPLPSQKIQMGTFSQGSGTGSRMWQRHRLICNHRSEASDLYTLIWYWSVYEKLWLNPLLHSRSALSLDIRTEGEHLERQKLTAKEKEGDKDEKIWITTTLAKWLFPSFHQTVFLYTFQLWRGDGGGAALYP